jgi:hypothetical protein
LPAVKFEAALAESAHNACRLSALYPGCWIRIYV